MGVLAHERMHGQPAPAVAQEQACVRQPHEVHQPRVGHLMGRVPVERGTEDGQALQPVLLFGAEQRPRSLECRPDAAMPGRQVGDLREQHVAVAAQLVEDLRGGPQTQPRRRQHQRQRHAVDLADDLRDRLGLDGTGREAGSGAAPRLYEQAPRVRAEDLLGVALGHERQARHRMQDLGLQAQGDPRWPGTSSGPSPRASARSWRGDPGGAPGCRARPGLAPPPPRGSPRHRDRRRRPRGTGGPAPPGPPLAKTSSRRRRSALPPASPPSRPRRPRSPGGSCPCPRGPEVSPGGSRDPPGSPGARGPRPRAPRRVSPGGARH